MFPVLSPRTISRFEVYYQDVNEGEGGAVIGQSKGKGEAYHLSFAETK